jgi:hypothetical protein
VLGVVTSSTRRRSTALTSCLSVNSARFLEQIGLFDPRDDRDVEPIKTEQKAASRIVELRQAGRSYREIATALGAEGHKPRRAASWSVTTARNITLREIND